MPLTVELLETSHTEAIHATVAHQNNRHPFPVQPLEIPPHQLAEYMITFLLVLASGMTKFRLS